MKLLALTFVRTTELIEARWKEIDFEARRWNIPAQRMKMDTPHIVPLSRQAIEVLEMLQSLTGTSDLVFPGERDPKRPMSNNTILLALDRMGYRGRQTGHGFRGLASTLLHEQGYPHEHIELQLAHAPRNAVSAAYNHALYLEPRTQDDAGLGGPFGANPTGRQGVAISRLGGIVKDITAPPDGQGPHSGACLATASANVLYVRLS